MYKNLNLYVLLLIVIFAVTACGVSSDEATSTPDIETSEETKDTSEEETVSEPEEEPIDLLIQEDLPSLYKQYEDYFTVGVAVPMAFIGDVNMQGLINKHFNSLTAENAMKPESMINAGDPTKGQFVMSDMYSNFAIENNIGLRGHTLVWHQQTPEWFYREDFSKSGSIVDKEVMYERLEHHIKIVAERYNNTNLYAWDVVNEVIEPSTESNWRESLWYRICGEEFVEKSFEYARKYTEGTDIKLYYNDYNVVADEAKRLVIYDLVKDLKEKDLIDGVGFQAHINITGPSADEFEKTIELFETLDVEISITELDISMFANYDDTINGPDDFEQRLIIQANLYKDIFDVCVDHSDSVANVTLWSLKDDMSWLNAYFGRSKNWPVLFDKDFQAKYAFWALVDPSQVPEPSPIEVVEPEVVSTKEVTATIGTPVIDGEIDELWAISESISIDTYTLGSSGATGLAKVLYDDENLYVLVEVTDDTLSISSSNPWEQDSVEIFIDENSARTKAFESDDFQYRFNYENSVTVNPQDHTPLTSATTLTETGYIVEVALALNLGSKAIDDMIGFDIQINDDQNSGGRNSMVNWYDESGLGYVSTEDYGTLIFK